MRNGGLTAARGDMSLRGTMAALAACTFGRLVSHRDAFEMRILVEVTPDICMAPFADVAAEIVRRPRWGRGRLDGLLRLRGLLRSRGRPSTAEHC